MTFLLHDSTRHVEIWKHLLSLIREQCPGVIDAQVDRVSDMTPNSFLVYTDPHIMASRTSRRTVFDPPQHEREELLLRMFGLEVHHLKQ